MVNTSPDRSTPRPSRRSPMRLFGIVYAAPGCVLLVLLTVGTVTAFPPPPTFSKIGHEVFDDSRWLIDSMQLDVEDVLTAPLYAAAAQSPLRSSRFYLDLGVAGVVWELPSDSTKRSRPSKVIWRIAPMT